MQTRTFPNTDTFHVVVYCVEHEVKIIFQEEILIVQSLVFKLSRLKVATV